MLSRYWSACTPGSAAGWWRRTYGRSSGCGERKAVRREGRDDVQRDDDGVGAHAPACLARGAPWRTPLTFLLEREAELATLAQASWTAAAACSSRPGRDRQDRAAGGGPRDRRRAGAAARAAASSSARSPSAASSSCSRASVPGGAAAHAAPFRAASSTRPSCTALLADRSRAADARRRRRPLARPPVAALARLHGQPRRRPAAGDRARRPQRRAGRAADPDRAAPVDDACSSRARSSASRSSWRELRADAAVYEATGGNPFYVHALLAEAGTPRSVVESVALRLDGAAAGVHRAGPRARRVGAGGTVAARRRRARRARAVEAAEALARADILRGDDFAHPLVRRPCTPRSRRPSAPRCTPAAARLLDDPERVAAQVMAAGPGGGVWAVEALRAAARAAWARGAPDVAAGVPATARAEEELPRAAARRPAARARPRAGRHRRPGGPPGPARGARAGRGRRARARSRSSSAGRCSVQGYFADACAAFEAGGAEAELATVAVLDLSLVRRFGGLDAHRRARARARRSAPGSRSRAPPDADGADARRGRARRPRHRAERARRRADRADGAPGGYEQAERDWTGVADVRPGARRARDAAARGRAARAGAAAAGPRRRGRGRPARADRVGRRSSQLPLRRATGWRCRGWSRRSSTRWSSAASSRRPEHWLALTGLEADWPEVFGFTFLLDSLARLRLAQGRRPRRCDLARECARRQRAWGIRNPGLRRAAARRSPPRWPRPAARGGARRLRRADRPRAPRSASRARTAWR